MHKFIAILGVFALCVGLGLAEEKTAAQLSDAVYDIQRGKDSVNQIQDLRVKDDAVIGDALTVTGVITASGGISGSGASLTSLPAGQLTGNIAVARMTNAAGSVGSYIGGNIPVASLTNAAGSVGSYIGGNIPVASLTNAVNTLTGTLITNTCIAADGKTNTYVFVPFGDKYVLKTITTSP